MTNIPLSVGTDRPAALATHETPAERALTLGVAADLRRMIESHGISHPGRVRTVNEDRKAAMAAMKK